MLRCRRDNWTTRAPQTRAQTACCLLGLACGGSACASAAGGSELVARHSQRRAPWSVAHALHGAQQRLSLVAFVRLRVKIWSKFKCLCLRTGRYSHSWFIHSEPLWVFIFHTGKYDYMSVHVLALTIETVSFFHMMPTAVRRRPSRLLSLCILRF